MSRHDYAERGEVETGAAPSTAVAPSTGVDSDRRRLLLIASNKWQGSLFRTLEADGWVIHQADDQDTARQLWAVHRFDVGILEGDPSAGSKEDSWTDDFVRQKAQIPWIYVASPEHLNHDAVRSTIVESCFDFHTTPIDPKRLAIIVGHAHGMFRLRTAVHTKKAPSSDAARLAKRVGFIGNSRNARRLFDQLAKAARFDVPVVITGETGTGKELAARALRAMSRRSRGPFVVVNCAALPETLIQSELFGHERGAFTGAEERKIGRLETAHGGTLFLDEIGELPLALQGNLLRFLQEGTLQRLGGHRTIKVDVRVVAATNVDISAAVARGDFREDLYYRLAVLSVHMPALRDRQRDMLLLAQHYLKRLTKEKGYPAMSFSPDAIAAIQSHNWPGNVRELINRVRRGVIFAGGRWVRAADLELEETGLPDSAGPALTEIRAHAERRAIKSCLMRNNENVTRTAKELGVSRATLYRLMEKHQIALEDR